MSDTKRTRPTGKKTSPAAMENFGRDEEAMRMRIEEHTWQSIADHCGYGSRSHAYDAVQRHMRSIKVEGVEELRRIEDGKLARGFQEVFRILNADYDIPEHTETVAEAVDILSKDADLKLKAIDRLDKLSGRRARLLGLEMPVKTEITGADGFPISINPEMLPAAAVEALRDGLAGQGES